LTEFASGALMHNQCHRKLHANKHPFAAMKRPSLDELTLFSDCYKTYRQQ
jgi:hypothetical protein